MGAVITVPGDQPTIQSAVNNAAPGDEIVLSDGNYAGGVNLNLMGSESGGGSGDITIRSHNSGGATVDGGISSAFSAQDFTGDIAFRGLNLLSNSGALAVIFLNNVNGSVIIRDNTFMAGYGGDGVAFVIEENTKTQIELYDNTFSSPANDADGLNVLIYDSLTVELIAESNIFRSMRNDGISVSVQSSNNSSGAVLSCRIISNTFEPWANTLFGNAIDLDIGSSTTHGAIASLLIESNTVSQSNDDALAIRLNGNDTLANVIVRDNTIDNPHSAGIYIGSDSSAADLTANILVGHNSINGPGDNGIEVISLSSPMETYIVHNVMAVRNDVRNPREFGLFFDANLADNNYSLNLELRDNYVEASGYGDFAFREPNNSQLRLGQGVSVSTNLNDVISENNNDSNYIWLLGDVTIVPAAVSVNQIPASLGGIIWNDLNGNGNQDDGEMAMTGVPVSVKGTEYFGGAFDWATVSDTNGIYMLPALLPGDYIVSVTPPLEPDAYTLSPNFADPTGSEPNAIYDPISGSTTISFTIDRLTLDAGLWIPDPYKIDDDQDGFSEEAGDCNDNDATISPEGVEICGDGIDQNCDGADLLCPEDIDDDGDGLTENEGDCDDTDATVYPGADEICGDHIDQNCDGSDEVCEVDTAPTLSDLQLMVMELKTAKRNKKRLNHYLQKAQRAFDKGRIKQGQKRIVKFMKKLVNQSNYKRFKRRHIAREDADKLIMAAAETLTGQPAGAAYSIAGIGSMVARLNTGYRTKASMSYRLFAADWASRLGFHRFSRNLLISFINKAVNCCDYRGRKASHRISIEEADQLIMAGASALTNLPWR